MIKYQVRYLLELKKKKVENQNENSCRENNHSLNSIERQLGVNYS